MRSTSTREMSVRSIAIVALKDGEYHPRSDTSFYTQLLSY